jgi:hypothetical protein
MVDDSMKLFQILSDEKLSSVAMISILNHNDNVFSYSLWKLVKETENQIHHKLYLFDNDYKISHVLFFDWDIQEIEPNSYIITTDQKYKLKIDLYFGGANFEKK